MRTSLIALLLTIFAAGSQAAECGGADAPCEIEGGVYHFAAPEGANPPALLFLHGFGGTGKGILRNRTLVAAATAQEYAVIAPQGLPFREGMKGGSWNSFADPDRRDDIGFLIAVADDAAVRHGVDRSRILLAGFSGGGMMTWRVACDAPDSFVAYAPVAGLLWRPLPDFCAGPFRMLHTHGWSDPVVPLEGRSVANGALTQGDLFAGLALMRETMECKRDAPDAFAKDGPYLIREWTDCAPDASLTLALHPGGHAIPKDWAELALDWLTPDDAAQ